MDMKARDEKEAKAREVLMILSLRHFTLHHHLYSFFGVEMQLKSFFFFVCVHSAKTREGLS